MSKRNSNPIDALFDFLAELAAPRPSSRTSRERTPDGFSRETSGGRPAFRTAEERDAWDELNDWLGGGKTRENTAGTRSGSSSGKDHRPSSTLDQDYANFALAPGADFSLVKAAYKRQLRQYHPDRHSGNPEMQRIATQITQKLNASYRRIKDHVDGGSAH